MLFISITLSRSIWSVLSSVGIDCTSFLLQHREQRHQSLAEWQRKRKERRCLSLRQAHPRGMRIAVATRREAVLAAAAAAAAATASAACENLTCRWSRF